MKKMTEKIGFTIENGRRARQKNKNFYWLQTKKFRLNTDN